MVDPAVRRPQGRGTVRTPEVRARILKNVEQGMPLKYAALEAGISETAFWDWGAADKGFAADVKLARARKVRKLVSHVYQAAPTNWAAAMTLLERTEPEEFARRDRIRHDHAGSVGLQVQLAAMDIEAIEMASALEERLGGLSQGGLSQGTTLPALPESVETDSEETL